MKERTYEYDELEGYEMPFGKHQNKRLSHVPLDYLEWVRDKTDSQASRIVGLYLGHPSTQIRFAMREAAQARYRVGHR